MDDEPIYDETLSIKYKNNTSKKTKKEPQNKEKYIDAYFSKDFIENYFKK